MTRVPYNGTFQVVNDYNSSKNGSSKSTMIFTSIDGILYSATEKETELHKLREKIQQLKYGVIYRPHETVFEKMEEEKKDLEELVNKEIEEFKRNSNG